MESWAKCCRIWRANILDSYWAQAIIFQSDIFSWHSWPLQKLHGICSILLIFSILWFLLLIRRFVSFRVYWWYTINIWVGFQWQTVCCREWVICFGAHSFKYHIISCQNSISFSFISTHGLLWQEVHWIKLQFSHECSRVPPKIILSAHKLRLIPHLIWAITAVTVSFRFRESDRIVYSLKPIKLILLWT